MTHSRHPHDYAGTVEHRALAIPSQDLTEVHSRPASGDFAALQMWTDGDRVNIEMRASSTPGASSAAVEQVLNAARGGGVLEREQSDTQEVTRAKWPFFGRRAADSREDDTDHHHRSLVAKKLGRLGGKTLLYYAAAEVIVSTLTFVGTGGGRSDGIVVFNPDNGFPWLNTPSKVVDSMQEQWHETTSLGGLR